MVLSFFSVADIRGFLQEDDGGGDGFGNVSYPFQRTDNEEKVDVEGREVLPFGGDQKGQRFAMGFVQFFVAQAYFPGGVHILRFQTPGGVSEFGYGHFQQREHNIRGEGFLMPDGGLGMLGDTRYFLHAFLELVPASGESDDEPQVASQRMELGEYGGAEGENLPGFFLQRVAVRNDAVGPVAVRAGNDPFQNVHVFQQAAADGIDAEADSVQGRVVVGEDVIAGGCHEENGLEWAFS